MKFFTLELYNLLYESIDGDGGLPEFEAALGRYRAHIETLSGSLGPGLVPFSEPFLIDDALLVKAELSHALKTLDIVLRCGGICKWVISTLNSITRACTWRRKTRRR